MRITNKSHELRKSNHLAIHFSSGMTSGKIEQETGKIIETKQKHFENRLKVTV